jgi:hypothetical protein
MPKKTTKETIITETDSKPEEVIEQVQAVEPTPEERDFTEYLESLGPTTNLIKIHKYIDGTRKYCGRVEPSTMKIEGEEFLLRHWGGGKYYLMAFFNNRYVQDGSRLIEIYEPPEDKRMMTSSFSENNESKLMREEIQRQHDMVLKLLETKGQQNPGPSLHDIVGALASMKSLVPPAPGLDSVLPGLVSLMKFAKEAVSDSSSKESSFGSIVEGALKAIPMIFGGLQNMKGNGGQPATQENQPVLTQEQAEKQLLGQAIARLKQEAVAGLDPELCVAWISSHQEDVGYRNMAVILLNRQFESLFSVDPDLEKEPLRSWFQRVYTELRKVFIDGNSDQESDLTAGGVGS